MEYAGPKTATPTLLDRALTGVDKVWISGESFEVAMNLMLPLAIKEIDV